MKGKGKMKDYKFLIFDGTAYDKGAYCDFDTAASVLAGKDILLAVWNSDGSKMLAISGQQNLTINRSAETIEINSKIVEGQDANSAGWKDSLVGLREWSIDLDSLWVPTSDSHKALATAFDNGSPVCVKVYNAKTNKGIFAGLAIITDFPVEAPYDDSVTTSISLQGKGRLLDLTIHTIDTDTIPE